MTTEHTNLASGYRYHGGNALILTQAANTFGYNTPQWCTKAQAEKLGRAVLPGHTGFTVMLNDRQFTVYNIAQLTEATTHAPQPLPAKAESAKVLTFKPTPEKTARASFQTFRDAMPNRAAGWPREARAFYDGLPNGGTYVANMGCLRGEFVYCALQYLAENGDSQGRRYALELDQTGWAIYNDTNPRTGKPLKAVEFVGVRTTVEGDDVAKLERLKERGLAHPQYRMVLKPATQSKAA